MNSDLGRKIIRTFIHNRAALFGLAISVVVIATCLLAPYLPLDDPLEHSMAHRFRAPSAEHILGTDDFGRDVLARIIWGGRISLLVGVLSVVLAMGMGMVIGLVAGYTGGFLDSFTMRIVDVLMCFPTRDTPMARWLWNFFLMI